MSYTKLKAAARQSLKGNWMMAVGLFLVSILAYSLIEFIISPDPDQTTWKDAVLMIVSVLLIPMSMGLVWAWIDLSRGEKMGFSQLGEPYRKMFVKAIVTGIVQGILIFLWSLLLLVPGIIKSFAYMLTYHVLRDQPELTPLQAITASRRLMHGHKADAFLLGLSFIGWILLGVITVGIGFIWIAPYISVTFAHFYNTLRSEQLTQPAL